MLAAALLGIVLAAAPPIPGDWSLTFADRFDGTTLSSVWSTRGTEHVDGMTHAHGDPRAVTVSDGELHLRVVADPDHPGRYLNGHIGTEEAFTFTLGYAEARIRFQPYKGSHGAFWLLTPTLYMPEIDVAEYMGANHPWRLNAPMRHHYYWGNVLSPSSTHRATPPTGEPWSAGFHDYGLLRETTGCTYYIDSQPVRHTGCDLAPKFLVLSLLTKDFEVHLLRADQLGRYRMDVKRVQVWEAS